jgi:Mg-chelatase subunit ChlD
MKFNRFREWVAKPLSLLLAASILPIGTASAATGTGCLTLSGTITANVEAVTMHKPFTFTYNITPSGTFTDLVRDPVDISLVLDVSGSMSYPMIPNQTNPTRLKTLKDSVTVLLDDLKTMNAKDNIGIVKFSNLASTVTNLTEVGTTSAYANLYTKVSALSSGGSTNIEDALNVSKNMLTSSTSQRKKFIVFVTDGYANTYRKGTSYVSNRAEARLRAMQRADEIAPLGIPVYMIALGTPGSDEIDPDLMDYIAQKTGGQKFDAANSTQLVDVFRNITQAIEKQGVISNIMIKQPLDAGFELTDTNPNGTVIENGILSVPIPSIPYPFDASSSRSVTITMKQTKEPGQYDFADANLHFVNACGVQVDPPIVIKNDLTLNVTGWVDTWGNLYTGDSAGAVSRYRLGDTSQKQFTVPGKGKLVDNITFEDSPGTGADGKPIDDDAIVHVLYEDGTTATWDLRPTAPAIQLTDRDGAAIAASDLGWHKGKGSLSVSGGKPALPANTSFAGANDDFQQNYVNAEKYRIKDKDGNWTSAVAIAPGDVAEIAQLGKNIGAEARTYSAAISGDNDYLTVGPTSSRTTSLDATAPIIELKNVAQDKSTDLDPTFTIRTYDTESPVDTLKVAINGINSAGIAINSNDKTISKPLSGIFTAAQLLQIGTGWKLIKMTATNEAGLVKDEFDYKGDEGLPKGEYILLNPGPFGRVVTKDGNSYVSKASGKPVVVLLKDVPIDANKIIVPELPACGIDGAGKPLCPAVKLTKLEFQITTKTKDGITASTGWKPLGAYQFQITSEGTNTIVARLSDSAGGVYTTEPLVVKIDYNQNRY